jgi:HPt (histidine-containing phosphotransfer) domain-containing protein
MTDRNNKRRTGMTGKENETVTIDRELEYLVQDYLDSRKKDATAIMDALPKEDYESIRILGHNMKGTGGGYGFEAISELGEEIQKAALSRDAGTIERLAGELMDYIGSVVVRYV